MSRSSPWLCRASITLMMAGIASGTQAQPQVARVLDSSPTRVLQIGRTEGTVSLRRAGAPVSLKPGFLVFNQDRVQLAPRARAELQLSRYGEIELAASQSEAALDFERLPFSSWAVDLETRMRLEAGVLRVRWTRMGEGADWPIAVVLDRWSADLGNGEFLFRRDNAGNVVCVLSGRLDLGALDGGGERLKPAPGRCLNWRTGESPVEVAFVAEDWNPADPSATGAADIVEPERSLQLPATGALPPSPRAVPVVTSPAAAVVGQPKTDAPMAPAPTTVPLVAAPEQAAESPGVADGDVAASSTDSTKDLPTAVPADPAADLGSGLTPEPAPAGASTRLAVPAAPTTAPGMPATGMVAETPVPPPVSAASLAPDTGTADAGATASDGPEWIINVMTVTDPEAAKRHLKVLTDAGYPAVLRQETVRGRASYRIIIGGIANQEGAQRVAELLAAKMGYVAAWPLQKR